MPYKVCHILFSTNRLEYLIPTLRASHNLNYYNCEVHKIFIDDYPKTRNNNAITALVRLHGFNEIILNKENLGLTKNWTDIWKTISTRDYDYVFLQEDDVVIREPVLVTDLIEILERDRQISQVQLSRQAWYYHEKDPEPKDDDLVYKNFRYRKESVIFSPMASLCNHKITKINFQDFYDHNVNEGMIGKVLYENFQMISANLKNFHGKHIITHIGEWCIGKRLLPGEPGYENWSYMDPDTKYSSRNGNLY